MIATVNNALILEDMSPYVEQAVKRHFTMENPKFREAEEHGRWTGNIPKVLTFFQVLGRGRLKCPRGATGTILLLCKKMGESVDLRDERRQLPQVDFTFRGELRPFQKRLVQDALRAPFTTLAAPTGSGKTCMALSMIAERKQPALVIVHTKELLSQWAARIDQFLGLKAGMIGGGKLDIQPVTVASVQTLVKVACDVAPHFGYVIADECHRAPAMQYAKALEAFDSLYMTGLSATPFRRDGLTKVIFWHVGHLAAEADKAELLDTGALCEAQVKWVLTEFEPKVNAATSFSKALSSIVKDARRNHLICKTIALAGGGGVRLVLTDRKDHCAELARLLKSPFGIDAKVLTGSISAERRKRLLDELRQGESRVLIATCQLIGEGFDLPEIESVFLTTPISYHGRLIQYIGRALRPTPGKAGAVIYDFVDVQDPVFRSQALAREKTYDSQGISCSVPFDEDDIDRDAAWCYDVDCLDCK